MVSRYPFFLCFFIMNTTHFAQEIEWLLREKYQGVWNTKTDRDVQRLLRGEPVDYVIGWMPFLGCHIDLSQRTLIPRPETEYWTERAIAVMRARKHTPLRVLDLFSGSGAIGIAVLTHLPHARVDFGDSDSRSYSQILKNIGINKIAKKRVRVFRTNVFAPISGRYDFILANPPYLARARTHRVAPSVKKYEPAVALWGGRNGLTLVLRFLKEAPAHLAPGGELWMEFDSHQKPAIAKLLKRFGYASFSFHKDQFGKWRYCVAQK